MLFRSGFRQPARGRYRRHGRDDLRHRAGHLLCAAVLRVGAPPLPAEREAGINLQITEKATVIVAFFMGKTLSSVPTKPDFIYAACLR